VTVFLLFSLLTTVGTPRACPAPQQYEELLSWSQGAVASGARPLLFCVYGVHDEGDVAWLDVVRVVSVSTGRVIQELTHPRQNEPLALLSLHFLGGEAPAPVLEDLSFDGYLDLRLFAGAGGTGNSSDRIWIYDRGSRRFRYNDVLSEESRLEIDPKRRELRTSWLGGHAGAIYGRRVYRWIRGRPHVVREEVQDWDEGRRCYEHILKEWRSGRLVETQHECPLDRNVE
jgi:hypothetical protein